MAAQTSQADEQNALCQAILAAQNHYEVLSVTKESDAAAIRKSYLKISVQCHPDRNASPDATECFQKVSEAYAVLSDPEQRRAYDAGPGFFGGGGAKAPDFDLMKAFEVFAAAAAAAKVAAGNLPENAGVDDYVALATTLLAVKPDAEGEAILAAVVSGAVAASMIIPDAWKQRAMGAVRRDPEAVATGALLGAGLAAAGLALLGGLQLLKRSEQDRNADL